MIRTCLLTITLMLAVGLPVVSHDGGGPLATPMVDDDWTVLPDASPAETYAALERLFGRWRSGRAPPT